MHKKTIALSALALATAGLAGIYGVTSIHAQEVTGQTLAQRLATKFGLNQTEVTQVIEEDRASHRQAQQAARQTQFEANLTQAVTAGKITEAQKQAILVKHTEHQAKMEALHEEVKDLSATERQAKMEAQRQEFEQWAKDNGIDVTTIMPARGSKAGQGEGRMMGNCKMGE